FVSLCKTTARHGHGTVTARHGTVTARSRHGHGTVTARSRHGHGTVTARSRHGHGTVTARSRHGHGTVTARSRHGHGTVTARSRHGHGTVTVTARSRHGHGTVTARSRHGHGTVTARSRHGHGTVTARSRHGHGTVTARSRHGHGTVTARSRHGHGTVTARSRHGHGTVTARHGQGTARHGHGTKSFEILNHHNLKMSGIEVIEATVLILEVFPNRRALKLMFIDALEEVTSEAKKTPKRMFRNAGKIDVHVWGSMCSFTINSIRQFPLFPLRPNTRKQVDITDEVKAKLQGKWLAQRIMGYLHPPLSGSYQFELSSFFMAELWLSDGEDPKRSEMISKISRNKLYDVFLNWCE
ncbi:hypothetical protein QZH41_010875, partial [Actinostola sp. cb2023]